MIMDRKEFISALRQYKGTPFHHAARLKGEGIDCMGVMCEAAKDIGYPFEDDTTYSASPPSFNLAARCAEFLDTVKIGRQQPGDIGLFIVDAASGEAHHAGAFTDYRDGLGLIHVRETASVGTVIEQVFDRFWETRLMHVFSLRGVAPWQP